jgi:glycosyltransferase involved in cell wall biosynthesis
MKPQVGFFITSNGWGGLEINTVLLAEAFFQNGVTVALFSTNASTLVQRKKEIFTEVVLLNNPGKYFDIRNAYRLAKHLKSRQIKTLFVFDNRDLDLVCWCKRMFYPNLRVVYQQHMQIGVRKADWLHTYRYMAIDWWVSPLPWLKQEVLEKTRFPEDRIKVIPIGLDVQRFAQNPNSRAEARKLFNIPEDVFLLGILGRISEKKGQLFIANCVQKLIEKGLSVHLLIFGSATINDVENQAYEKRLHLFVQHNQLQSHIHFSPGNADVLLFYKAIDVFVLGSHSETYGMVTLEAMLSKVPIIATRSGGTPEILGQGKFGSLYPYEDQDSLLKCIEEVQANQVEAAKKAELAFEEASQHYDKQIEVKGMLQLIG